MSEYRLLVSCPLIRDSMEQYDDRLAEQGIGYDVVNVEQHLDENELLAIIDEYHAILAGDDELTERVLSQAEQLQVIAKWGIGLDSIDSDAANELNIAVYNTPNAFGPEVVTSYSDTPSC